MPAFADVVTAAKAIADPTRVRMVAVLRRHELTVSELCAVLDQSQPRVSRHLKLLVGGGLLVRNAQGSNAFYREADTAFAASLGEAVTALLDAGDLVIARDERRLAKVLSEREEHANEFFEVIANQWDDIRRRHVHDDLVESAIREALPMETARRILDLGTGTGRMLELLADRTHGGIGIDLSRQMLDLARARLEEQGHLHLRVKHGSIFDLDVAPGDYDVALFHHVLHFLDDPAAAIAQAAEALQLGGHLLIIDFEPHTVEALRDHHGHRRLGVSDAEIVTWTRRAGFEIDLRRSFAPDQMDTQETLTVSLWRAHKISYRPVTADEELAS